MRRAVKYRDSLFPQVPLPLFSRSDRSVSSQSADEEACPALLRAGLLYVGFSTMESSTLTAALCACVRVCVLKAHQVSSQYDFLSKQELSGKHKPC